MNVFQLTADTVHLFAVIYLLVKIWKTQSCSAISGRSQILFAIVYTARYLDLVTTFISIYNTSMKIIFLLTSYFTLVSMYWKFRKTYDKKHDTFRIEFLILFSIGLAMIFNHEYTILEVLWTVSIYLEALAILPQLLMSSKSGDIETISIYLLAMGSYRMLYVCNWNYRYFTENFFDPIAYWSGCIQTLIYGGFVYLYNNRPKSSHVTYLFESDKIKQIFSDKTSTDKERVANEKPSDALYTII